MEQIFLSPLAWTAIQNAEVGWYETAIPAKQGAG